jgi:hypothetical protein
VYAGAGPWSGQGGGIGIAKEVKGITSYGVKGDLIVTVHRFLATDDTLTVTGDKLDRAADRTQVKVYGQYHSLPELRFFGVGPTAPETPIIYGMTERVGGVSVTSPLNSTFVVGGGVELRDPRLGAASQSIFGAAGFSEATVPGLVSQPMFVRLQTSLALHSPSQPPFGEEAHVVYRAYLAADGSHYSFGQLDARGQTNVNLGSSGGLTFLGRVITSTAFGNSLVPFYYQPTLGGQDVDGFDTLRGFDDVRFRGPDAALVQADYTHSVICDALRGRVFGDVGQVTASLTDVTLRSLRSDWGVGLDLFLGGKSRARVYSALNGERRGRVAFAASTSY